MVRQVLLTDAPAVLGWAAWRAMEARYSLGVLEAGLGAAAQEGRLPAERVTLYAHVLLAVLTELALFVAGAADRGVAIAESEAVVGRVLAGMMG